MYSCTQDLEVFVSVMCLRSLDNTVSCHTYIQTYDLGLGTSAGTRIYFRLPILVLDRRTRHCASRLEAGCSEISIVDMRACASLV